MVFSTNSPNRNEIEQIWYHFWTPKRLLCRKARFKQRPSQIISLSVFTNSRLWVFWGILCNPSFLDHLPRSSGRFCCKLGTLRHQLLPGQMQFLWLRRPNVPEEYISFQKYSWNSRLHVVAFYEMDPWDGQFTIHRMGKMDNRLRGRGVKSPTYPACWIAILEFTFHSILFRWLLHLYLLPFQAFKPRIQSFGTVTTRPHRHGEKTIGANL